MMDKVACDTCGSANPAKCVQCNANAALSLPAASWERSCGPVNATAAASPVKLLAGRAAVGDERERTKAEARLLPGWALREKAQRIQEALAAGGVSARLPDGGRMLRLWLDACLGEISSQRRDADAAPNPHGGNGEAPVPDIVVCEICGSGSRPNLMVKCARCNAHEHRYCIQVVAYSLPHEWYCYECQEKDNGDPKQSSQEVRMASREQSSMGFAGNKKNLSETKSTANVPLNDPHMEELEVETDPTQLQSILPTEVPMATWEQSPMSVSQMRGTANVLLENSHVEEMEAKEETQDSGKKKTIKMSTYNAGQQDQDQGALLETHSNTHIELAANHADHNRKVAPNRQVHPPPSAATSATAQNRNGNAFGTESSTNPLRRSPRVAAIPVSNVAAIPDNDDDDFEQIQPPPRYKIAGHKRSAGAAASRQPPPKRSLLHSIEEQEDEESKPGKTCCRCTPKDVIEAIKAMSDDQKDRVTALGWGKILDITIDAVASRDLYKWLLTKIDVKSMVLSVPPHTVLPVSKHSVHTVLGVPTGTRPPPKHPYKAVNDDKARLAQALGCPGKKITIDILKGKLREHQVDDLSIRWFFLILFNRLLFSTTQTTICNQEVEYTMNWEYFADVDWQQAIIDDIRDAANGWNALKTKSANPSLSSCPLYLIIYYLDNLLHKDNNDNRLLTPRAALFTKEKVLTIMHAARGKDAQGKHHYGCLAQKSQTGSAYEADRPLVSGPSPSWSSPPFSMPVLSNILQGYTGRVVDSKQFQIEELVVALDTDVRDLNQAMCARMFKFADDIRSLLDGASTTAAASGTVPEHQDNLQEHDHDIPNASHDTAEDAEQAYFRFSRQDYGESKSQMNT